MTIKQMMTAGAAALTMVGAFAPAASAVEPHDGLSDVLHEVGATVNSGDESRLGNAVAPESLVSTGLTSRVGDGLKAMSKELLR